MGVNPSARNGRTLCHLGNKIELFKRFKSEHHGRTDGWMDGWTDGWIDGYEFDC